MKQDRVNKNWTPEELDRFQDEVIMAADTNAILNYEELADMFGRTVLGVKHAANKLRHRGELPKFCKENQIEKYGSFYSKREKQMIMKLRSTHTHEEIAKMMGRTKYGIESICRKQGPMVVKKWTESDLLLLINNIEFDSFGVTANYDKLTKILNRNVGTIQAKIRRLRLKGVLPPAKRSGMPEQKRAIYRQR